MELTHTFDVPAPPDEAWSVLTDIARIGPCMPGATIESIDGNEFTGSVTVKVGPMRLTYRGAASFSQRNDEARTATITASGRETRGAGTAKATVHASLAPAGSGSTVVLTTDLNVTGRPAQFGRGVLNDVGRKLVDQFAAALAEDLATEPAGVQTVEHRADADLKGAQPPVGGPSRVGAPAVDLVQVGWAPVARRLVPVVLALILVRVLLRRARRRS